MFQVRGEQEVATALQFVQEILEKVQFGIVFCKTPKHCLLSIFLFFYPGVINCGYQVFCCSLSDLITNSIAWQMVSRLECLLAC